MFDISDFVTDTLGQAFTIFMNVILQFINIFDPNSIAAGVGRGLFNTNLIPFYFVVLLFYPIVYWQRKTKKSKDQEAFLFRGMD